MKKYDLSSLRKKYQREDYLERKTPFIVIVFSVLLSLFFFSFNLTGNITDSPSFIQDGNILGVIFLLVGLAGLFLYLKKRSLE